MKFAVVPTMLMVAEGEFSDSRSVSCDTSFNAPYFDAGEFENRPGTTASHPQSSLVIKNIMYAAG